MEGKQFAKFVKDLGLLDKKLTATDVDLVFAKIKDKAARKITYTEFENGLDQLAVRKGITGKEIRELASQSKGPILVGTKAEAVKYHDDKSLYTGVHANGGPSTVDSQNIYDISQLCDRTDADVRGTKNPVKEITNQVKVMGIFEESKTEKPKKPKVVVEAESPSETTTIKELFA